MARELKVVIATAGRAELLERTLRSLLACEKPAGYRGTIVIENGPPGHAEAVVASLPVAGKFAYRHTPRANKSHALNVALEELDDGDLIYFTDDDVRFAPEVLVRYAEAAADAATGRFFGGPAGVDYETAPPAWLRKFLPPSAAGWELGAAEPHNAWSYFLGFNWAAFAGDVRRLGGFNPEVGPGGTTGSVGQETDMQMRLRNAEYQGVYVADARVWHYVPRDRCSPKWVLQRAYRQGIHRGMQLLPDGSVQLFGLPRWRLRECAGLWRKRLTSQLSLSVESRFEAAYQYYHYCGILRGVRLARQSRTAATHDALR